MTRDLIVSSTPQETKAALLEDGVVSEIFIEREAHRGIAGYIYKGQVTRVLPGMQSAFVDLGLERDAFLHVADVFEELPENLLTAEEQEALGRWQQMSTWRKAVAIGAFSVGTFGLGFTLGGLVFGRWRKA